MCLSICDLNGWMFRWNVKTSEVCWLTSLQGKWMIMGPIPFIFSDNFQSQKLENFSKKNIQIADCSAVSYENYRVICGNSTRNQALPEKLSGSTNQNQRQPRAYDSNSMCFEIPKHVVSFLRFFVEQRKLQNCVLLLTNSTKKFQDVLTDQKI